MFLVVAHFSAVFWTVRMLSSNLIQFVSGNLLSQGPVVVAWFSWSLQQAVWFLWQLPSGNPDHWCLLIWHYWCLLWGWLALFYLSVDYPWLAALHVSFRETICVVLQHIDGDLFGTINQLLSAVITLLLLLCLIRAQQTTSEGQIFWRDSLAY